MSVLDIVALPLIHSLPSDSLEFRFPILSVFKPNATIRSPVVKIYRCLYVGNIRWFITEQVEDG